MSKHPLVVTLESVDKLLFEAGYLLDSSSRHQLAVAASLVTDLVHASEALDWLITHEIKCGLNAAVLIYQLPDPFEYLKQRIVNLRKKTG